MASSDAHPQVAGEAETGGSLSTGGAMARARARRMALVGVLAALLLVLAYVAYYYSQNRAFPVPRVVAQSQTVEPPEYLYSFAGVGSTAMTKPTGIGIIGDRVYVTDLGSRGVRAYTREGDYLFDFGPISDGTNVRLDSPVHIAIGPDSTVWVTDRGLRGVYVFDRDGKFLRKFTPKGSAGATWSPLAIAFSPDGDVYISDVGVSTRHQILRFGPDGTLKAKWGVAVPVGGASDAPGAFQFPDGLAIAGTGASARVYVADGNNHRVQVFHADGTFVSTIQTSGTPRGLAIDGKGRLWVVDALAHQLDLYSAAGAPLTSFGGNGVGPGEFDFPNDVIVDAAGPLFITDRDNNQVQVWGYPVGVIPGVTRITPASSRALAPWLVLILAFIAALMAARALRPRRFVVTASFVGAMVENGQMQKMVGRRWRWVVPEADRGQYEGRSSGGVDLGGLLHPEPHSSTDAEIIRARFALDPDTAATLALARRFRVLCTEDIEAARLAVALGVDVYDRAGWLERFAADSDGPGRRRRFGRRRASDDGTAPR
jgi:sugar lactone lactonase YvrE